MIQSCWDNEPERRPSFGEIVCRYHDGIVPDAFIISNDTGYVLLGPEEEAENPQIKRETINFNDDDSESLMNAILKHFQKSRPASFVSDAFLNPSKKMRASSQQTASLPNLEYYMDMSSRSSRGSIFVNQMMHEYDNISIGEEEKGDSEKMGDHMTTSMDHMTKDGQEGSAAVHEQESTFDLPKSNSDYILMQSAEPANPTA